MHRGGCLLGSTFGVTLLQLQSKGHSAASQWRPHCLIVSDKGFSTSRVQSKDSVNNIENVATHDLDLGLPASSLQISVVHVTHSVVPTRGCNGSIPLGFCLAVGHELLLVCLASLLWGCAGLSHLSFIVQAAEASKHFLTESLIFQIDPKSPSPPSKKPSGFPDF